MFTSIASARPTVGHRLAADFRVRARVLWAKVANPAEAAQALAATGRGESDHPALSAEAQAHRAAAKAHLVGADQYSD